MCGHCEHHGHECECRGRGHHRWGRAWEETCGCGHEHGHEEGGCCGGPGPGGMWRGCGHHEGPPFGFHRRFVSQAERIAELEAYLAELRAEAKAVEEHLADLKTAA
jgi:hypothetical protein